MINKYIGALEAIQNPKFKSREELQTWQAKAVNLIIRIYGENSKQEEQINKVEFRNYPSVTIINRRSTTPSKSSGGGHNGRTCESQAEALIIGYIDELNMFGIPEPKLIENNNGINVSVIQNQSVNVNVVWDSIKDELTGKQIKEIEDILDEKLNEDDKKAKVFDRIKSFGSDIASNVLANLITNLFS